MRWKAIKYTAAAAGAVAFFAVATFAGQHREVLSKLMDGTLEQHAGAVFAYQNQVAAALLESIDRLDNHVTSGGQVLYDSEEFYALEDSLNAACEPLQDVAYSHAEGEEIDGVEQLFAVAALIDCEREAGKVEYFVWLADPDAAKTFLGENYLAGVVGYSQ